MEFNFRRDTTTGEIYEQIPATRSFFDDTPSGRTDEVLEAPDDGLYVGWIYDSTKTEWTAPVTVGMTNAERIQNLKSEIGKRAREVDAEHNAEWPDAPIRQATLDWHHSHAWMIWALSYVTAPTDAQLASFMSAWAELQIPAGYWYAKVSEQTDTVRDQWISYGEHGSAYTTGDPDGGVGTLLGSVTVSGVPFPTTDEIRSATWSAFVELLAW